MDRPPWEDDGLIHTSQDKMESFLMQGFSLSRVLLVFVMLLVISVLKIGISRGTRLIRLRFVLLSIFLSLEGTRPARPNVSLLHVVVSIQRTGIC